MDKNKSNQAKILIKKYDKNGKNEDDTKFWVLSD